MYKRLFIIFLSFILLSATLNISSDAFFLKRKKSEIKQGLNKGQKEEVKKVLLVQIFASWCPGCKNIQPTLDELFKEAQDVDFIKLDVSTPSKVQESSKKAKELGILDFYQANKSKTATVAIITPTTKELISILENNNDLEEYKEAIEKAKTKEKALENPPA